jgi:CTP synthase (UTP-ammonia lyase)
MTIAIVGDRDGQYALHLATEGALERLGAEARWIPTPEVAARPDVLAGCGGLLIPPGSPYRSMDGALAAIRYAREHGLAFLGTCSGFQHALIEFARNVIGIPGADHPGLNPEASDFVCAPLACATTGQERPVRIGPGTLAARLYQAADTTEPFYCSYGLTPGYRDAFENAGMRFTGFDHDGVPRVLEIPGHPFFLATLYVPQAASARDRPHPVLAGFARASSRR